MFDTDLNVFYSGGSGGFYFLHCLLMQQQHFCSFPVSVKNKRHPALRLGQESYADIADPNWPSYDQYLRQGNQGKLELIQAETQWAMNPEVVPGWFDQAFDSVHQQHWQINTDQWKSTEIWPDNSRTLASACVDRPYRIFFTCNYIEQWLQWPGKKIVLYTDIRTQTRLSMYKKAWKYINPGQQYSKTKQSLQAAEIYNNDLVGHNVRAALNQADDCVRLQDFVQSMLAGNKQQQAFTDFWLKHHPADLLRKCALG